MIPYLHLGPLQLPTFGLMVALALITAAYVLQADFDRRGLNADAFTMITVAGLTGIFGAKLYHLLETPSEFFANPVPLLLSRYGFAWFGGFLGGFGAMLMLGWRARLPVWKFLDACSPAASFGYAIGRIGCFLSGDGDYGKPTSLPWGMSFPNGVVPTTERVHPAPLYELLIWSVIGWLLWRIGARYLKSPGRAGVIFCYYLILTGAARFLVEMIRINPPWILGMSNAQVASVACVIAGCALLLRMKIASASR
ncbi:MAG TPA: prolipoprotein diacylglyceryl transferase [Candidatus Limnocylindrales bacterium]|nr:prolipoprotein diacylglyceryl transferase [Candidatus Limnocylindrales bacterium]